jgi:hypothetical protein
VQYNIQLFKINIRKESEVSGKFWILHNEKFYDFFKGIMAEGRINKMADLQETKFLRLFGLTNVHTPKCNCLYLCVEQHQYYALQA